MKTTNYHTNDGKKKPAWTELMSSLKIDSSLQLTLANCVRHKFYKDFKEWGIVYVGTGGITYHSLTDEWNSPEWDGGIEKTRLSILEASQFRTTRPRYPRRIMPILLQ
jgi:hypothetical protein